MIHALSNCCLYIFENRKQKPFLKSNNGMHRVHYGPIDLGSLPANESVENIYGAFSFKENKERYSIILETASNTYHKDLTCDFNGFLDITFCPRHSAFKYSEGLRKRPWIVGELNEMEIS